MAKLNIVGVGPGSADYVTPAARRTVTEAQLVIGAQRSLALFRSDLKGESIVLTAKNLVDSLKAAARAVRGGKSVALLSTGDPGFSGLLHTVLESGLFDATDVHVVAGVSSIQASAARLNISWDCARFFTFHEGTVTEEEKEELALAVKDGKNVLLLPSSKAFAPRDIAAYLLTKGVDKQTTVYVCENITLENEKITQTTLADAAKQTFGALCVMVIKQSQ
ncbi:MAG: precorrin-6y C5,15-methyltransferase (decarboxylating) subunit CbiE [Candidatus Bathyarchaeota archaeon]|nr:precorrin-6y C5,15-methyltransferase (decarboxylating) subunit CbiE [Candidatus Bathyarchaeota archaeon]